MSDDLGTSASQTALGSAVGHPGQTSCPGPSGAIASASRVIRDLQSPVAYYGLVGSKRHIFNRAGRVITELDEALGLATCFLHSIAGTSAELDAVIEVAERAMRTAREA